MPPPLPNIIFSMPLRNASIAIFLSNKLEDELEDEDDESLGIEENTGISKEVGEGCGDRECILS